ncbi:Holliday junction resolvase RecU [Sporosarcina sp. FSL K6-3457]|uniref:Holliday junction resolvase RecU n=1 Tax=Sporosarcina sp. FSL K6-3457 TaxID=2978204 RepID=UPI0030F9DF7E
MQKSYNRSKANLGKQLERLIDMTHHQYRNKGVADIRKVPTPVQITSNNRGKVTGYTQTGEWVDYVGAHNGKTIVFDAKETKLKSFPLENLQPHQYELLKSWREQGAAAFLIVQFTKLHEEIYLLPFKILQEYWEDAEKGGRKSIPHSAFIERCDLIKSEGGVTLHYLKNIRRCLV